jgi:hypothetical protein
MASFLFTSLAVRRLAVKAFKIEFLARISAFDAHAPILLPLQRCKALPTQALARWFKTVMAIFLFAFLAVLRVAFMAFKIEFVARFSAFVALAPTLLHLQR